MMPAWHQLVSMSGHVEESERARKLQLYATSIYQVHSFVCQLDYIGYFLLDKKLENGSTENRTRVVCFKGVPLDHGEIGCR